MANLRIVTNTLSADVRLLQHCSLSGSDSIWDAASMPVAATATDTQLTLLLLSNEQSPAASLQILTKLTLKSSALNPFALFTTELYYGE